MQYWAVQANGHLKVQNGDLWWFDIATHTTTTTTTTNQKQKQKQQQQQQQQQQPTHTHIHQHQNLHQLSIGAMNVHYDMPQISFNQF